MAQIASTTDESASRPVDPASFERAPLVDRESAAWAASVVAHVAALTALAALSLSLPTGHRVDLSPLEVFEDQTLPSPLQEFVSSDQPHEAVGALSALGELSALGSAPQFDDDSLVGREFEVVAEAGEAASMSVDLNMLQGPELLDSIPVQGAGSVGVTGAAGAVDRLTHEILASLEQRPTLVAWLFDQSGSLRGERAAILKRFRRIYVELAIAQRARDEERGASETGSSDTSLLTAVIGFGATPRLLTPKPAERFAEVEAAVEAIEDDETGTENVFTAVATAANKFRTYESAKNGRRRVMIVVFTDEAGDDADALDATAELCRKFAMPVYVVGRPAPFGRDLAYVKWIDPDPRYDQRPQWVPVRLGPESAMPELLKLRFADRGEEELLDSGFGPYALTRLCYETGGLYFSTHPNRVVGRTVSEAETNNLAAHFAAFFDPDVMRRYQPDYVPSGEYLRQLQGNAARRALVEAAQLSWTSPLEDVRLRFPKRDEAELARELSLAQRSAAIVAPKIDLICRTLLAGEEDRAGDRGAVAGGVRPGARAGAGGQNSHRRLQHDARRGEAGNAIQGPAAQHLDPTGGQ